MNNVKVTVSRKLLFFVTIFMIIFSFQAMFGADLVDLSNWQVPKSAATRSVMAADYVTEVIGLSSDENIELLKEINGSGKKHYRYRQTYQGIPVYNYHILIAKKQDGTIIDLDGIRVSGIENDIKTTRQTFLQANEVLSIIKDRHYAQNRTIVSNDWEFSNESSELVIYIDDAGKANLAYEVSYFADTKNSYNPTRPHYIVDATTLEVLYQYENLMHANGTGPGGNQKIGQYEFGSNGMPYLNVTKSNSNGILDNSNVITYNLNHGTTTPSNAHTFTFPRNTVKTINGAYSPLNDAHYFGEVVYDMFLDWFNTKPLTSKLIMRVHYSTEYENAFWNGSSMTFGDGKSLFYPLTGLDVVAHEVSHGFTEQNSDLKYEKQSGGINESFSDMAGKAAEYYARGSNNWDLGYDIFKDPNRALRYMDNPPEDGKSIDHVNDYYDGMDVHYSSGVYNKVFWKLATTSGWNTKKAFEVFTKANQVYWHPTTDFVSGAKGALKACKDLNYSTKDVVEAFKNVGINLSEYNYEGIQCYVYGSPEDSKTPLYRYWHSGIGDHFYTTNWAELGSGKNGWKLEGIQAYVYKTQVSDTVPLYRYWHSGIGDHFYTTSWSELGSGKNGWKYEGVQCYVRNSNTAGTVPLYRYWHSGIGDHFYTTSWSELGSGKNGWKYEGIQCYVNASLNNNKVPLFRYWHSGIGDHFYTTSWAELGSGKNGWTLEGIQCYVHSTKVSNTVPLYRYWNSGIGDHFYTTSWAELGSGKNGWKYEGIQCYVYNQQVAGTIGLHRFWFFKIGDHFYTTNKNEVE